MKSFLAHTSSFAAIITDHAVNKTAARAKKTKRHVRYLCNLSVIMPTVMPPAMPEKTEKNPSHALRK